MREKTVKRYFCDFCSKGMFSKLAMQQHEITCTKNPKRFCWLCQADFSVYLHLVSELKKRCPIDDEHGVGEATKEDVIWLRQKTDSCPTCALAVLQQAKVYAFGHFDYKVAVSEWHREQMEGIGL